MSSEVVTAQLIEQLIPYFGESDFDAVFQKLAAGESANSKFLIKMELNRLTKPCTHIIDFRVTNPNAQLYTVEGINLYLTQEDLEVFTNELRIYHGKYTVGVYEKVIASHRERRKEMLQKAAAGEKDSSALEGQIAKMELETVRFASYFYRSEERMNYSSPAILYIEGKEPIAVKTSDLSCGGIKLAIEEDLEFNKGDLCTITFTGLQKVIADPLNKLENSPYSLLNKEERNGKRWVVVIKKEKDPDFSRIIDNFIQANKLKYSVSVDNLLTTVETKGYEQFYLPRTTALPLFFSQNDIPQLLYCLKSENNQGILEYWRDEGNNDRLASIFSPKRMSEFTKKITDKPYDTYVYAFRHMAKNRIYFFSATLDELERDGKKDLFFTVGSARPTWKVYKLSIEKTEINEKNVDRYIGNDVFQVEKERVSKKLLEIGYVGQIIEVGSSEHGAEDYQAEKLDNFNANDLQEYIHQSNVLPCNIEMLHYIKMRKEPRYIHQTPVSVKLGNKIVSGWTKDISTLGLQIEINEPLDCKKDDIVYLTFPKLQELTREIKLKDIPYSIVHANQSQTILHLQIFGKPEEHVGKDFFNRLIESNKDTLEASKEMGRLSTLSKSLRYIFTRQIFTSPLYLSKNKINRLSTIGVVDRPRQIYQYLSSCSQNSNSKSLNVYPLFHDKLLRTVILDPLRTMERNSKPQEITLMYSRDIDSDGSIVYDTKTENDFKSHNEKRLFCAKALKRHSFVAIRLYLTRTGKPDIDYISDELTYISKYAKHKAKRLEDTVWSIIGVCDMVDVTEEVLTSLNLPRTLLFS